MVNGVHGVSAEIQQFVRILAQVVITSRTLILWCQKFKLGPEFVMHTMMDKTARAMHQ